MRARPLRAIPVLVLSGLVLALVLVGPSLAASSDAPKPLTPTGKKPLPAGQSILFTAKAPKAGRIALNVSTSRARGKDGLIGHRQYLATAQTKTDGAIVHIRTKTYKYLAEKYFVNRPGTYYWQVYLVDCTVTQSNTNCYSASSPRKFVIK